MKLRLPYSKRGSTRFLLIAERLFLLVGLLAVATYVFFTVQARIYQSYESWAFDRSLRGESASASDYLWSLAGREPESAPQPSPPPPPAAEPDVLSEMPPDQTGWSIDRKRAYTRSLARETGSPIGRLQIPNVGISVMVLEGTDSWTLNRAVGRIEGTAYPGKNGNVGIAGHRDSFFRRLKDIRKGEDIELTTREGKYRYRVDDIRIVQPRDVAVLKPTPEPALTLVTCYPFYYVGEAPKRFIVRARLEDAPADPAQTDASGKPEGIRDPFSEGESATDAGEGFWARLARSLSLFRSGK